MGKQTVKIIQTDGWRSHEPTPFGTPPLGATPSRMTWNEAVKLYRADMDRRDEGKYNFIPVGFLGIAGNLLGLTTLIKDEFDKRISDDLDSDLISDKEVKENWERAVKWFGSGHIEAPERVMELGLSGYYGEKFSSTIEDKSEATQRQEDFQTVDTDGDGVIDTIVLKEPFIITANLDEPGVAHEDELEATQRQEDFQTVDTDGDGVIDTIVLKEPFIITADLDEPGVAHEDELEATQGQEDFQAVDTDGDGAANQSVSLDTYHPNAVDTLAATITESSSLNSSSDVVTNSSSSTPSQRSDQDFQHLDIDALELSYPNLLQELDQALQNINLSHQNADVNISDQSSPNLLQELDQHLQNSNVDISSLSSLREPFIITADLDEPGIAHSDTYHPNAVDTSAATDEPGVVDMQEGSQTVDGDGVTDQCVSSDEYHPDAVDTSAVADEPGVINMQESSQAVDGDGVADQCVSSDEYHPDTVDTSAATDEPVTGHTQNGSQAVGIDDGGAADQSMSSAG